MKNQQMIDKIANVLLLVGGIHLGLAGLFGFYPLDFLGMAFSRIVEILIGVAAVYRIVLWAKAKGR